MTQTTISEFQLAQYRRDGYLVLRSMFDAAEMTEMIGWIDEVQNWPETPGRHMMYFEQSLSDPPRRVLNRLENFSRYHDGLSRVVVEGRLRAAVSDLFGDDSVLFKDKVNFKLPGGGGFEAHQDAQAGWNDYADPFITAMVTIDPTTIENGCLEVAHWDHRAQLIGDLWKPLEDSQLDGVTFEPVPTEPGDVMFFDSYLPHRSAPNLTESPRRVLYITYNKATQGDHRAQYYADKRKSYPPDCEREDGKVYEYKV